MVNGRVTFMSWRENYLVVYLINVTWLPKKNPTPILLVEEKYKDGLHYFLKQIPPR